ncbi:hypothetical protein ACRAWD_07260 [Caulobacter segnis]
MVKTWKPTSFGVLYSNRFGYPTIGEFGILGSFVSSRLASRSDAIQVSNFGCRTNLGVAVADCGAAGRGRGFPRGAAFRSTTNDRKREGQAAAAVEEPRRHDAGRVPVSALEVARQVDRARGGDRHRQRRRQRRDLRPIDGTSFTFDDRGVFTNGVITGTTGWRADQQGSDPRTPINGLQSNNVRRDENQVNETTDYGFNFKWTPNEHWGFLFEPPSTSTFKVDAISMGVWGSTFQNASITLHGSDVPDISFIAPASGSSISTCAPFNANCTSYLRGSHNSFSDPYNNFWRSAMDHIEQSDGTEDAVKFDVEYKFNDDTWFDSVKAGVRWAERDQTTRFSTYNWGVLSEIWAAAVRSGWTSPINGNPNVAGGEAASAWPKPSPSTTSCAGPPPRRRARSRAAVLLAEHGRQLTPPSRSSPCRSATSGATAWRAAARRTGSRWRCDAMSSPARRSSRRRSTRSTRRPSLAYLMGRFKGTWATCASAAISACATPRPTARRPASWPSRTRPACPPTRLRRRLRPVAGPARSGSSCLSPRRSAR